MDTLQFITEHWGQLLWGFICIWLLLLLTFSKNGRKWLSDQWEWFKSFFLNDDKHPESPDHKILIMFAVTMVFVITFLRFVTYSRPDIFPDIPEYWALFFFGTIGVLSGVSAYKAKIKNGNGNGNGIGGQNLP